MSDTAKTVLIVGGAAVGAFVLIKLLQPSRDPLTQLGKTPSNTSAISLNGLIGLGTSIFNAFGSSDVGRPTSGAPSVGYEPGESFEDFYTGMFGPGSLDVAG